MRELASLAHEAVELARARRAECEVWLEYRTAAEVRAVGGDLEQIAERTTLTGTITTWRDGHEGCAVIQGTGGVTQAVDAAVALGEVLPRRERVVRAFPGLPEDPTMNGSAPIRLADGDDLKLLRDLSARSALVRDVTLEAHHASTAFGESGGAYGERRSSCAVTQSRFATGTANGSLTRSFVGRDAAGSLRAAAGEVDECLRYTEALGQDAARWEPPATVLLHGHVMARLLSLLAPSVQLDSVAQRKSRLADRLGERIAAPGFRLVDDAPGLLSPVSYRFDDEGTLTRSMDVIAEGRLLGYLSDVRHAVDNGSTSTGAGWRSVSGGEVRIRPSTLIAGWEESLEPAEPGYEVYVLQATGMHISNDVTGDFSFGAVGVRRDSGSRLRNAGSFTVAGNVIDMLKHLEPVRSPVRYVARSDEICASPDIAARGLVIGA
jgi:predicted Zn-dependent protease